MNGRSLLGLFFVLGAVGSACNCSKKPLPKTAVPPELCEAPKRINSRGQCVDCVQNSDCKVDQKCNLLTGTCEGLPQPQPDAGQAAGCFPGARRCAPDNGAVQDCESVADGGHDWVDTSVCTGGTTCNKQTLTCAICVPGESVCNPEGSSAYQRCKRDGTGFEDLDCNVDGGPGGFTCTQVVPHSAGADGGAAQAGLASCRLCQPNSSACSTAPDGGQGILSCDSTGTTQEFHTCYPTNVCNVTGSGPQCQTPVCYPGTFRCGADGGAADFVGPERLGCNDDGTAFVQADCAAGLVCGPNAGVPGGCLSPCQVVENSSSYFGCDYWGALLPNVVGQAFTGNSSNYSLGTTPSEFAFVVSNTSTSLTAHVTVDAQSTNPAIPAVNATVAPGSTQAIHLPWRGICGTGLAKLAYHLTSDVPVTVYQFNPLASAKATGQSCSSSSSCPGFFSGDQCVNGQCMTYSYTNDASLLLPTHLLGTSYVVVSNDQITEDGSPLSGTMTVVATEDNTHIRVKFAGSAISTQQSSNNSCSTLQGNVPGKNAGDLVDYTLSAGQVLQFYSAAVGTPTCTQNPRPATVCLYPNDFTGTVITSLPPAGGGSPKPIAVFGGSDCTYKPYDQVACDHIEEEMFPFSTWGKKYVGVRTQRYAGSTHGYPDFYRLVSACGPGSCPNGADVTISPPIANFRAGAGTHSGGAPSCATSGATTTCHFPPLNSGETAPWVEFQHGNSFVANSNLQPISLAQYFVSESEAGAQTSVTEGDPSLVMVPPVEQWRTSYQVLAPETYAHNYLSLAIEASSGATCDTCGQVQVDGTTVPASEWTNVSGTNFFTAIHPVCGSGNAGCTPNHSIQTTSGAKVGVVVYGYDSYVSYGYAGGLDLQTITVINPGG